MKSIRSAQKILLAFLCIAAVGAGVSLYQANHVKPDTAPTQETEAPAAPVAQNNTPPLTASVAERTKRIELKVEPAVKAAPEKETPAEKPAEQTAPQKAAPSATAEPSFAAPVPGNVVMDFSMDRGIYDVTLEQYRTNDRVSLSAKTGDNVLAAEAGTVASITQDAERGVTLVIDHSNGWQTTYSQLSKEGLASEGAAVKKGQAIGTIADPTKYSVLLGSHLDFGVMQDGVYVDPMVALAE